MVDEINVTVEDVHSRYSDEEAQDVVSSLLVAGDKLSYSYDDTNNTLTLDTTALDQQEVEALIGDSGGYTDEQAQDAVNALMVGGAKLSYTYDDANNTLTLDTTALDQEEVQDVVSGFLAGGDKLTYTYDDTNNVLTLDTTALDQEEVEDVVSTLLVAGDKLSYTYDDTNGTLTLDTTALDQAEVQALIDSNSHTRYTDEEVQDVVSALLVGGSNITATYDDTNNALTLDTTALNQEEVEDAVSTLLAGDGNISITYDDTNNSLTIGLNAHAATHEKGGSDELTTFGATTHDSISLGTLNSADITNAASGTVPTAQGDGTLLMESASGGSTVDIIAPLTASGIAPAASGAEAVAIGTDSTEALGNDSIAMGRYTSAAQTRDTAIGYGANANYGTAYGDLADASGSGAVALGSSSTANAGGAVALGKASLASGFESTALGDESEASGGSSVSISKSIATQTSDIAIGYSAEATGSYSTAVGSNSHIYAKEATGLGRGARVRQSTDSSRSIAIGYYATVGSSTIDAPNAVAIGPQTTVENANVGRIGVDQLVFGGVAGTLPDSALNNQELTFEFDEANSLFVLKYRDSAGTLHTATI